MVVVGTTVVGDVDVVVSKGVAGLVLVGLTVKVVGTLVDDVGVGTGVVAGAEVVVSRLVVVVVEGPLRSEAAPSDTAGRLTPHPVASGTAAASTVMAIVVLALGWDG